MEEVTHGIDKNPGWFFPMPRSLEPVRMNGKIKSVHEAVLEPAGYCLDVAMLAAGTNFVAPSSRIPAKLSPLDCGRIHPAIKNGYD